MRLYPHIKRLMDIVLSLFFLALFMPVIILEYILVRIFISKQAIFVQERGGINFSVIKVYKFKTMLDKFDRRGNALPDKYRLSKIGNVLRKLSIDELLQFFNVLKGDMSIIGPRPLILSQIEQLPEKYKVRSRVRPGITGLAQVNGRNSLTFSRKYEYDIEYVKNYSFAMDMKILWKTIFVVFSMKDNPITTPVKELDDIRVQKNYGDSKPEKSHRK